MMYNYIDCERRREDYHKVINKITKAYETYFSNINRIDKNKQLKDFINNAVYVVDDYRKDLHLDRYIQDTCSKKQLANKAGSWVFKGKINGKYSEGKELYQLEDTPLFYSVKYAGKPSFRAVSPRFYRDGQTLYMVGYEDVPASYKDLNNEISFKIINGRTCTYDLYPISKNAEADFKNLDPAYTEEWNEEQEKYAEAYRIAELLNKHCDEIFYGLVEVSPLYCD